MGCAELIIIVLPMGEDCTARTGTKHEGKMFRASLELRPSPGSEEPSGSSYIVHWLKPYPPRLWAIRTALQAFCSGGRITVHLRRVPWRLISF